jgi:hypothetical protein
MEGFPLPKMWNTPVYEDGELQRWVEPDEALILTNKLYPSGAQMYEVRKNELRPWRDELHKLGHHKDSNTATPCAIPAGQMRANVGEVKAVVIPGDADETKRNAAIARAQIKRAQSRIREWPTEGRDREGYYRAVTIVPRIPESGRKEL